ncbi:MAG: hypothetical protein ACRD0U_05900 [Acidimicrobiales bacterium]
MVVQPVHIITELDSAIGPIRARHRQLIADAVSWGLGAGEPLDPASVALVCAGAEFGFAAGDNPLTRWTRPRVNDLVMRDAHNWSTMHHATVPEDLPRVIWRFLAFLHATGRLDPSSDPLDNLREPLMCYGGLDADGQPRPRGTPAPFPCQCYFNVRVPSRPGLSQWETPGGVVIELRRPSPAEPRLVDWWKPLIRVSRQVRRERMHWLIHLDEFFYVGRMEQPRGPDVSVYRHGRARGEFYVDDEGGTYRFRPDRRRKLGARLEACDLHAALWASGLPHVDEGVDWPSLRDGRQWDDDDESYPWGDETVAGGPDPATSNVRPLSRSRLGQGWRRQ